MKSTGFLGSARAVAAKDLRLEWRTLETLSITLVFSLVVLVIFSFAFGFEAMRELGAARLVPGVFWSVLAFAAVVGMARSMQLERARDTLSALFLAPVDRGAIFTGKLAANIVKLTVLQWIVMPLAAVFFDFDLLAVLWPILLVLFLHVLGLAELGTLFAAISTRLGRGEALLATLLFPAATPIFISAVKCTAALLAGEGLAGAARSWLLMTIGFDVLYYLVGLLTFEFILEE
jgi:heme exporter protein B